MNGQDVMVVAALIAAVAYLLVRSRRARALAKAQSQACSRCSIARPDQRSGSLPLHPVGTVSRPRTE